MNRRMAVRWWHWAPALALIGSGAFGARGSQSWWWIAAATGAAVLLVWREGAQRRAVTLRVVAERAARKARRMPAQHPEWFTAQLPDADEEWLAQAAAVAWPDDEYLAIVHEFGHPGGDGP